MNIAGSSFDPVLGSGCPMEGAGGAIMKRPKARQSWNMGASPRNGAPVVGIAAVTGLNQPLCGLVPTGNSAVDAVGIMRRTGFQHTSTWRMERTTKRQNIEADKKLRKQGLAKKNRRRHSK